MPQGIYIASAERLGDRSLALLGIMELLTVHAPRVGFFKPVAGGSGPYPDPERGLEYDWAIDLAQKRYKMDMPANAMYGVRHAEAIELISSGRSEELAGRITRKYRDIEADFDFIICEGTDLKGDMTPLDFDFNTDIAKRLGCMMVPVLRGRGKSTAEIAESLVKIIGRLEKSESRLLAFIVDQVDANLASDAPVRLKNIAPKDVPVYVMPENIFFGKATVADVAAALSAAFLNGKSESSSREVSYCMVANKELSDFLKEIRENTLVITSGERYDILLGSVMADASNCYPRLAGIVLTKGSKTYPNVQKLIDGFERNALPILSVNTTMFAAEKIVCEVEGTLSAGNDRKIGMALGIFESNVDVRELMDRAGLRECPKVTPPMIEYDFIQRARRQKQHIVLPEGEETRILTACEKLLLRQVVDITLLGNKQKIKRKITDLGLKLETVNILDPLKSDLRRDFAEKYSELRKRKHITKDIAYDIMADACYFGTMMVHEGHAGGMVSGLTNTTQHTISPSLQLIKTKQGLSIISSLSIICMQDRMVLFGYSAAHPVPDSRQLADIAVSTAESAAAFGLAPGVVMLARSMDIGTDGSVDQRVGEAIRIVKRRSAGLEIAGPLPYQEAFKLPASPEASPECGIRQRSTVCICPDLQAYKNALKMIREMPEAKKIGQVFQGMKKPVNSLSEECTIEDIMNIVTITAVQAQAGQKVIDAEDTDDLAAANEEQYHIF